MRKNKTLACMLAALALTLTACSNEDDPMAPDGDKKEITILTRTATEGEEATNTETFTGDFTLELWNDGVHTTHQMTYTESTGWNAVKVDKLGTNVTALAHRGETVTFTSATDYSVALTEDQSDVDAFNAADVMTATGTVATDGSLSLNFEHCFAKVTFKVTLADEFKTETESGTALTPITNLHVMTKDGSIPEVTTYCSAADSDADYHYDCSAYIPADIYKVGDTFAKIDIGEFTGDKRLEANMSEDNALTLTAGTHYTFSLKVGKDKVTIGQVITDNIDNPFGNGWDNDSETDLI